MLLDVPVHASAVAIEDRGLLIIGPSGAGKSSLALSLMALGAVLIGDDRVVLSAAGKGISIAPVAALSGKIEARGIGIISASYTSDVMLSAIADLSTPPPSRLPEENRHREMEATVSIPLKAKGDNPLWVCVTTEDGFQAWSFMYEMNRGFRLLNL